jgi:hypothetical protein
VTTPIDLTPCAQCDHPRTAHQPYGLPGECSLCGCDSFQPYPEPTTAFDATPCHGCGHQRVAHYGDVWGTYCRCCPCPAFRTDRRQHITDLAVLAAAAGIALTLRWAVIRQTSG